MKRMLCIGLLLLPFSTANDVQLRDEPIWDEEITLDLKDAALREVLTLAFQIAGQPVVIDPCVSGSVTLKFENVPLRDGLATFARMGELRVRPRSEGYFVGCLGTSGEGERIEVSLREVTADEELARPVLQLVPNTLAEIEVGGIPVEDLDDTGEFHTTDTRPSLRVKLFLLVDDEGALPDRLRGLLEIHARDDDDPRLLRAVATGFEIELPGASPETLVAEVELGGKRYALRATRP